MGDDPEASPTPTPMLEALFVYTRALRLYEVEEYDQSISSFGQVIKRLPNFAQAYRGRALVYHKEERLTLAMEDLDKAIEVKPDYADAYRDRGTLFQQLGERDKAIADLEKALTLFHPVREFSKIAETRTELAALRP